MEVKTMPDKKVTIPIGPQHPALKEPERFTITLNGEKIFEVDIRLG
jgi:Ni,Fe-hydrogenase III large subunit